MSRALLSLCLLPLLSTPSYANEVWKNDVKTLYYDLMEMVESGQLKEYGFSQGASGYEWLQRAESVDEKSPPLPNSLIPTTTNAKFVVVGELIQLGRSIFSTSNSRAEYAASMAANWEGAIICIDYPVYAKKNRKQVKRISIFLIA
ncbi:MAG: hypothetical protein V7776_05015 [Halopseudomonas aestusnigri]